MCNRINLKLVATTNLYFSSENFDHSLVNVIFCADRRSISLLSHSCKKKEKILTLPVCESVWRFQLFAWQEKVSNCFHKLNGHIKILQRHIRATYLNAKCLMCFQADDHVDRVQRMCAAVNVFTQLKFSFCEMFKLCIVKSLKTAL